VFSGFIATAGTLLVLRFGTILSTVLGAIMGKDKSEKVEIAYKFLLLAAIVTLAVLFN
jgi:hypothetical protein